MKMAKQMIAVRTAHREGLALSDHPFGGQAIDDYATGSERAAFWAGFLGLQLADEPVRCTRYGMLPPDGRSRNGATGEMEPGVSVVSAGDDFGSTANFTIAFISNRPIYRFQGLVVKGRRGSDGEPLVIPVSAARKTQRARWAYRAE